MTLDREKELLEARKQINAILANLESATNMLVESISLEKIEITKLNSPSPQYKMDIRIEMMRLPGHKWWTTNTTATSPTPHDKKRSTPWIAK